jgi:hypothetical protein
LSDLIEPDRARSSRWQINMPSRHKRPTVVDTHDHAAAMTNGYSCANSFLWDSPPKSLPQIERRPMSRPASPTTACQKFALFRGWQNLLNTDLINEVFAFQVDQLCTLFVVGQMRPNPLLITITSDRSLMSIQ